MACNLRAYTDSIKRKRHAQRALLRNIKSGYSKVAMMLTMDNAVLHLMLKSLSQVLG